MVQKKKKKKIIKRERKEAELERSISRSLLHSCRRRNSHVRVYMCEVKLYHLSPFERERELARAGGANERAPDGITPGQVISLPAASLYSLSVGWFEGAKIIESSFRRSFHYFHLLWHSLFFFIMRDVDAKRWRTEGEKKEKMEKSKKENGKKGAG